MNIPTIDQVCIILNIIAGILMGIDLFITGDQIKMANNFLNSIIDKSIGFLSVFSIQLGFFPVTIFVSCIYIFPIIIFGDVIIQELELSINYIFNLLVVLLIFYIINNIYYYIQLTDMINQFEKRVICEYELEHRQNFFLIANSFCANIISYLFVFILILMPFIQIRLDMPLKYYILILIIQYFIISIVCFYFSPTLFRYKYIKGLFMAIISIMQIAIYTFIVYMFDLELISKLKFINLGLIANLPLQSENRSLQVIALLLIWAFVMVTYDFALTRMLPSAIKSLRVKVNNLLDFFFNKLEKSPKGMIGSIGIIIFISGNVLQLIYTFE